MSAALGVERERAPRAARWPSVVRRHPRSEAARGPVTDACERLGRCGAQVDDGCRARACACGLGHGDDATAARDHRSRLLERASRAPRARVPGSAASPSCSKISAIDRPCSATMRSSRSMKGRPSCAASSRSHGRLARAHEADEEHVAHREILRQIRFLAPRGCRRDSRRRTSPCRPARAPSRPLPRRPPRLPGRRRRRCAPCSRRSARACRDRRSAAAA